MRSVARLFVLFLPLFGACNGLTGVDKYVLDDAGAATTDGGSSGSSGSSGASSGSSGHDGSTGGDGSGVTCPVTTTQVTPRCSGADLTQNDYTAPGADRTIRAPSDEKEAPFVPNCMLIRVGQTVTWTGDLKDHPIIPRDSSTAGNPIVPSPTSGVPSWQVTFPCPGDFNFSCFNHRDAMLGTIRVVP